MARRNSALSLSVISLLILGFIIYVQCSFVTKVGNGFERLVVSIDDQLALPPTSSSSASISAGGGGGGGGTGSIKGATHDCHAVLEQLKVSKRMNSFQLSFISINAPLPNY